MARESTAVFKGVRPSAERTPNAQSDLAADLRELMVAVEPRVRNLFQQNQGFRLKFRDDPSDYVAGSASDIFFIDGETPTDNAHFAVNLKAGIIEVGMVLPNHAKNRQWERFNTLARDKIKFLEVLKQVRAEVPELWIRLWHRHDMGGQKVVEDGEARFKVDTIYGFDATQTENRYFKPASSWYVLMKELISERMNHRFNLEVQFYVPYFTDPEDPRRVYRDKIAPYLYAPEQPDFLEETVRLIQTFGPFFAYLLG
ncbi:MAG TPA: hypothetical protein VNI57_04685 [Candidatus Saccharimonadales bacterium]|nr:hypothetical protein [Candidatus Saccharimonadales bacterium]